MNQVVVVIPVYKDFLTKNEKVSLNRCLKILGSHEIVFVSPETLSLFAYKKKVENFKLDFKVHLFADSFFTGIDAYNKLMLSKKFYERFSEYDFMLIYQLDAYVFRDELIGWCEKDFDYIGAPLIGNFYDSTFTKTMRVGNGGFSLRKISTFLTAYKFDRNLLSIPEIIKRNSVFKKPWTRIPLLILMIFGYKNNLSYFASNWNYNEDDFWSEFLDNTSFQLKKPTPVEAMKFAFERFPDKCFEIIKTLPFGCHAWDKYDFELFWKKYIYE
jgi:hypothetical protein